MAVGTRGGVRTHRRSRKVRTGGKRRELPSAGGPLAANNLAVFSGGPTGLSAWLVNREAASEVAVGFGETTVVYWLDGTRTPRSADITL